MEPPPAGTRGRHSGRRTDPIEPDQALRARVVGLFLGAVLALYGERERLPAVRDEALASLERALVA